MSSKLNNYPPLLEYLFNLGRQTGDAWIAQNGEALGQRSTMDVQHAVAGERVGQYLNFPRNAFSAGAQSIASTRLERRGSEREAQ